MFIQTEDTPNPATLKFIPGCAVLKQEQGIVDIPTEDKASVSPLAQALFAVQGVAGVMLGDDFVSVTKTAEAKWETLRAPLFAALMDFFVAGVPVLAEGAGESDLSSENDSAVVRQIKQILNERVRPVVMKDGGDIVYQGYQEGVVYLKLRGACAGCPGATATLKRGVESLLRQAIPEVKEVRRV